jgi:hypothetical protein
MPERERGGQAGRLERMRAHLHTLDEPPMDTTVPPSEAVAATVTTEDRTVAILSYITLIGFIAAIFVHQNRRTELGSFHLRQMLGLALTSAAGAVCAVVPILADHLGPGGDWCVCALDRSLVSALKGEMRPVPILGEHYQRWFAGVFA